VYVGARPTYTNVKSSFQVAELTIVNNERGPLIRLVGKEMNWAKFVI
jgi:hypothetical protein